MIVFNDINHELVDKGLITESVTLYMSYGGINKGQYTDGTARLSVASSSSRYIMEYVDALYDRIKDPKKDIKRVNLTFNNVVDETMRQYDLFTDPSELERENRMQKAVISIKHKFGNNAILKGMNLEKGGMTIERNNQIGGHRK